jgi:ParB-like chromosome segregation protein Spo0J
MAKVKAKPCPAPVIPTEIVEITSLTPHPRNYRNHTDDQIDHIIASMRDAGIYRSVVVAADGTILAGHGIVLAAQKIGLDTMPVVRLNTSADSPKALKVLAGDNEISHLAESDDRLLADMLKELFEDDELLGTGYDEQMLAALALVTRPATEIADFDEAAEWLGMPEFPDWKEPLKITVLLEDGAARQMLADQLGMELTEKTRSVWYPPKKNDDVKSVHFED